MATISNTPRPGYVWDATDNVWYPIGVGGHGHPDYITQATAVNPTIIDAKGDIITATAADTPSRLAVGNNGETLVADSAATTGLRYSATPSASNPVINSAMQVWQRGTTFAANYAYTADRWQAGRSGGTLNITVSRQVTGDTTNLPSIQYCARVQRDSGVTTTNTNYFGQNFETVNSIPFTGKTVTLSFYARAGANYSSASSALTATLANGTGTDQNYLTGAYTGPNSIISSAVTLTTTWQRFTASGTVPTNSTEMAIQFSNVPVGTAGSNDYFEVTGVQIDVGSVALPFRTYAATIQGELAACQRYFIGLSSAENVYTNFAVGVYGTSTIAQVMVPLPVTMRVKPSISVGTVGNYTVDGVTGNACSNLTAGQLGNQMIGLSATTAASTTGYGCYLRASNTASALIQISAEL